MTFLSVIITTHNRPAELLRALLHLAHQYYKNFEVIVVDDSIDNVKRINKRVTEVFSKILTLKYIDVPSINISGARNIGLRHSRGDYIAFLDDDDYWLPKKLILQLKRVREGYNFIFTGFVKVNQRGRAVYSYYPSEAILRNPLNLLKYSNFIATSSVLVRRSLLEAAGCFDENLLVLEDYDCWLRIAEIEKTFAGVREILTILTESRLSASKNNLKQAISLARFSMKWSSQIEERKVSELLMKACEHLKMQEQSLTINVHRLTLNLLQLGKFYIDRIPSYLNKWRPLLHFMLSSSPHSNSLVKALWFFNDNSPLVIKRILSLVII